MALVTFVALLAVRAADRCRYGDVWSAFPSSRHNSPADKIEVCEREQREHLGAVLGDAAIADLAVAELAFDDAKHVLDFGAHFAEAAVASALALRQRPPRLSLLSP